MGPELSATSIGALAAAFAGASTPFAILIGGIGGFALARIVAHFSSDIADAGGIYAFVKKGLGQKTGFLAGWLYLGGLIIGLPAFLILAAVLGQEFLSSLMPKSTWISGHWIVWVAILGVIAVAVSWFGVRLSVRLLLLLSAIGIGAITILDLIILAKGGAHGIVWSSLSPSHLGHVTFGHFGIAVGLALTAFTGFEGAVYLAEESVAPKRHVPIAVTSAFLGSLVFYLLTSLAMVTGYGTAKAGTSWPADSAGSVFTQSITYANTGYGQFLLLMVAIASFVAAIAVLNTCSRLLMATARDGYLPRALAATHPRHKTPGRALAVIAIGMTIVSLAGLAWKGDSQTDAFTIFSWLLLPTGVALITGIATVAVAGAVVGYVRKASLWRWLIEPLVALAVVVLGVITNFYPAPPSPYSWAPYTAVLWLAVGVIVLIAATMRGLGATPDTTGDATGTQLVNSRDVIADPA
jgi:amino acid transporter